MPTLDLPDDLHRRLVAAAADEFLLPEGLLASMLDARPRRGFQEDDLRRVRDALDHLGDDVTLAEARELVRMTARLVHGDDGFAAADLTVYDDGGGVLAGVRTGAAQTGG